MLSGGQDVLLTTNTKTMILIDCCTDHKIQRSYSQALTFFDKLMSAVPGKIGDDSFLHAEAGRVLSGFLHTCNSMFLEKQSTICALLKSAPSRNASLCGACQKPTAIV